ncbi:MAG: FkbM family methyltransferase [Terriglobales bacterium]
MVLFEIYRDRIYTRNFPPLSRGASVLDIGANVGLFAVQVARLGARVTAVEPNPAALALLNENVSANGVQDQVRILPAAVGSRAGSAELFLGRNSIDCSLFRPSGPSVRVRVIALDELLRLTGPVDLLKLDAEGAEFDLLWHAPEQAWQQVSRLAVEVHADVAEPTPRPEVLARLGRLGFRVVAERDRCIFCDRNRS